MTPSAILKALVAALALGLCGWLGYTLYQSGGASQRAATAEAVVEQQAVAARTTKTLQAKVDEANRRLRTLEADRAAARERLTAAEQRLLDDPNSSAASVASVEALRDYAAEVERDFAECRAEVAALADEAAGASDAAHALSDSWPAAQAWADAARTFSEHAQGMTK